MKPELAKLIFITAAIANIGGVAVFCKGFTNTALNQADPTLFSNFGLLMIMVWGLTYLAAARYAPVAPLIALAFAVEKAVYVMCWVRWMSNHRQDLPELFNTDLFAGTFMAIYGGVDFVYMLLFAWVFWVFRHHSSDATDTSEAA